MTKKQKELVFFGIAGILGYLIDVALTTVFLPFVGPYVARVPSFIGAATVTWLFNRRFTFADTERRYQHLWKEYLHYLGLMVFGLATNYTVYAVSITLIGSNKYAIPLCVAFGSLAGMVVNYVNSKKHLYRTKPNNK